MGYFTNQIRKSYYAALLTAFYIALQAFIMLTDAGPASPNLRDVQSMYMMQTLRSVNDDATVSQRAGFAMFFAADRRFLRRARRGPPQASGVGLLERRDRRGAGGARVGRHGFQEITVPFPHLINSLFGK